MKAYRIHSIHSMSLDELQVQPVGNNCVKLKNLLCGISPTDVFAYTGKVRANYPIIPARRCVSFVSETGEGVTNVQRGNRVVVYPQASCHNCKPCKEGKYYACEKPTEFGIEDDGFLSDFSVVSADDVYAIPDRIKNEEAVYIEQTAIAINVINQLQIEKGAHLVIVGATEIGILLAQVAMYYQAVPIVVDMHEDLLDSARQAGAYYTINSVEEDVNKKVLAITGGHMANACAYLYSPSMPLQNVFDCTARRGRVALVGRLNADELKCNLKALVDKHLDLISVVDCGKNYPSAINMLANHTIRTDVFHQKIVEFNAVPAAFEEAAANGPDGVNLLVKI
ncbi:MAG: alcohol dehydrogenase catalytic domain-containing protein [Clostridiales bacterium]|nr:alcohol dehydrogenase catalytic domain-containing protein [Clostridiales bacterium]